MVNLSRIYLYFSLLVLAVSTEACHSSQHAASGNGKNYHSQQQAKGVNTKNLKSDERKLVEEAMTWLGTPYRYGGQDYSGTDCSGLTMKVYHKALGIKIPRNSAEQQRFCKTINRKSLNAGDLLFFCTGRDKTRVSHVGLYIGDGRFIHSSASRGVIISHIDERYYATKYHSSGFVSRKGYKQPDIKAPKQDKKKATPKEKKAPETQPLKFEIPKDKKAEVELNQAIENRIDSIYSSFLD